MGLYNSLQQIQLRTHTPGRDCPVCTRAHQVLSQTLSSDLLFPDAFEIWISRRRIDAHGVRTNARYLKWRTEADYVNCEHALSKFKTFATTPIGEITPEDLMRYQEARAINLSDPDGAWWCHRGLKAQGPHPTRMAAESWAKGRGAQYEILQTIWAQPAGANRIRKEIELIIRILTEAGLWGKEQERAFLRLQPVESEVVHAMTIEEQHRFLHVAADKLAFRTVYQYAIVALQTTMSTNELRELRLCDVLLADRIIQVPPAGAKNSYRFRAIPIVTEDAMWALEGLIARARELGAVQPSHYLFPFRIKTGTKGPLREHYDPSQPMSDSGLKKQWNAVRIAAGLPRLRMYDLRHTGITRMAEAGVPLAVTMTFAGHMTRQMQQRYTAICMASQRGWGATVWGDGVMRGTSRELSTAWPIPKPVASETLQTYQSAQQFRKKA